MTGRKISTEGKTAVEILCEATGREVCPRCRCCEMVVESETCWACGGVGVYDLYEDDPISFGPGEYEECEECKGEGEITYKACLGRCDEHGRHKQEVAGRERGIPYEERHLKEGYDDTE